MSNLKEMINSFVDSQFSESSPAEQSLLKILSLKKVFSNPYYKNMYYGTSVGIKKNRTTVFITNEYDLDSGDFSALMHNTVDPYPDYSRFDSIKKYLINSDVKSRIDNFIFISKNYSSTINEYTDKLIEAQKGDREFLSTLNSFKYIIPEYKEMFFNEHIKQALQAKGLSDITSELCKNETYIFSYLDSFNPETASERWNDQKQDREESISTLESHFEDINVYYKKYGTQLAIIDNYLMNEKPYLFETSSEQQIDFSYYQARYDAEGAGITLQKDFCFSEDMLTHNDISISDIYSVKPDKNKYETFKEVFFEHLTKKDDDISDFLPSRFYGLDFLNDNALHPSSKSQSCIIAKANNDIVGLVSFDSTDSEGTSVLKNIGYVCIKDNFRGTGLVEKIYDKLASLFVDNNNILVNSHYTDQGRDKLPKVKDRIRIKYPDFLMLDTDIVSPKGTNMAERCAISSKKFFNEHFRFALIEQEQNNLVGLKKSVKDIAQLHHESMKYIEDNKEAFSLYDFETLLGTRNKFLIEQKDKLNNLVNKPQIKYKNK
ncbi:hypothetical protein ACTOJ1_000500 [Shigella flexneri]